VQPDVAARLAELGRSLARHGPGLRPGRPHGQWLPQQLPPVHGLLAGPGPEALPEPRCSGPGPGVQGGWEASQKLLDQTEAVVRGRTAWPLVTWPPRALRNRFDAMRSSVCIGRRSASSPRAHRGSRSARSRRPSCSSRFRHVSGMIKVDKDNSVHCCHGPADTPQSLAFAPALDRLAQSRSVVAHADL